MHEFRRGRRVVVEELMKESRDFFRLSSRCRSVQILHGYMCGGGLSSGGLVSWFFLTTTAAVLFALWVLDMLFFLLFKGRED